MYNERKWISIIMRCWLYVPIYCPHVRFQKEWEHPLYGAWSSLKEVGVGGSYKQDRWTMRTVKSWLAGFESLVERLRHWSVSSCVNRVSERRVLSVHPTRLVINLIALVHISFYIILFSLSFFFSFLLSLISFCLLFLSLSLSVFVSLSFFLSFFLFV